MHHRITRTRLDHLWTLFGIALVLAVFVTGCEGTVVTPTTPTQAQTQTQTTIPAAPTPTFDLSPFVGVWDLTLRLTEVKNEAGGGGCVAETLQSQVGVPAKYSLTITADAVAITDPSRDWTVTFTSLVTDESGFTTARAPGSFTAKSSSMAFRCSDGTTDSLWPWASGITGTVSGTELSGTWGAMFERRSNEGIVHVDAEYTGRKR